MCQIFHVKRVNVVILKSPRESFLERISFLTSKSNFARTERFYRKSFRDKREPRSILLSDGAGQSFHIPWNDLERSVNERLRKMQTISRDTSGYPSPSKRTERLLIFSSLREERRGTMSPKRLARGRRGSWIQW